MSETFGMDGSAFVFGILGQGRRFFDVLVNGVDNMVTNALPSDGTPYWFTVTFATAASRTITLRNAYGFSGIYLPVTNDFFAPAALASRMVVLGDSFAEQGYEPDAPCAGVVSQLQSLLPAFDIWALAEGGTGYVDPGPAGRTNFLGRIGDVIRLRPSTPSFTEELMTPVSRQILPPQTWSILMPPICCSRLRRRCRRQKSPSSVRNGRELRRRQVTPTCCNCGGILSNACNVCAVPISSPLSPAWITRYGCLSQQRQCGTFCDPTLRRDASDDSGQGQ